MALESPAGRLTSDRHTASRARSSSAALVKAIGEGESTSIESDLIAGQPSWRIHLAYFLLDKQTMEPNHEQDFRIFANGVVDELVIDYGDFTIDAVLEDLKPLPEPGC